MRAAFAGVLIGLVVGGAALAPPIRAQPAPDLSRAKDLYLAAEKAMADGRYADAIRDYGATFELTRDPVLFYKIAAAHEKAGKCDVALIYYGRYVKEARPGEQHLELTRARVRACGGDERIIVGPRPVEPVPVPDPGPGSAEGSATGSAAGSATPVGDGSAAGSAAPGPGSAAGSASVASSMSGRDRGAWLLVASSIGFVTIGAVLAYSANSAESDISDLYVGFTGSPSSFDDETRDTYDDLVAEGRRYEKLSWLSFGLAGVSAVAAIVLFKTGGDERAVQVTPTVAPGGGGVRATLRW